VCVCVCVCGNLSSPGVTSSVIDDRANARDHPRGR